MVKTWYAVKILTSLLKLNFSHGHKLLEKFTLYAIN